MNNTYKNTLMNLCEKYKDALYETLFWLDILGNDAV